ncbi:MAG: glycosyltransferase, partial [Vulcanimicrobiaceae bacterium]
MGQTQATVSIIITSFNYATYLPRALESAIRQSTPGMEIVVVDNASEDESWSIIENVAARDNRIRPFRNERNLGMIGNHVRALEHARGRRVLFLSADDYLLPGHVARLVAAHQEHPDIDYIFTSYVKVDDRDRFVRFFGHPGHLRSSYFGGRNEFSDLLTYDCYMCFPTTLFLRDELLEHGGFREELTAGDLDTYLRLASRGSRFAFLDTAGVAVRLHALEITGEERYVATGRQLLDHIFLLEQYLNDTNESLVTGRERGIARLLEAKIINLRAYPQVASKILPEVQPRIEDVVARLNRARTRMLALPKDPAPKISVLFGCGNQTQLALEAIDMVAEQEYTNLELILVSTAPENELPLLLDRARALNVNAIHHTCPAGSGISYNDGLRLTNGELVTYLEPGVRWPSGHLDRLAQTFAQQPVDLVIFPADLIIDRLVTNGPEHVEIARFAGFAGTPVAQTTVHVGEGIPLYALAHRRIVLDTVGTFDERLPMLADVDFVQRLLVVSRIAADDRLPVEMHQLPDAPHQALRDPNAYIASLRALYNARPADAPLAALRESHLARVHHELEHAVQSRSPGTALAFAFTARGPIPEKVRQPGQLPRVLVIDDRVPYNELGRGYPRARTILEDLRDGGYAVTFYPTLVPYDQAPLTKGIDGIDILYGRGRELLAPTLRDLLPEIDVLWVSRPHNMSDVKAAIGPLPPTRTWTCLYDAEAVYAVRDAAHAALGGTPFEPADYARRLEQELAMTDGCDAVVAVSAGERAIIAQRFSGPIEILSFSIASDPTPKRFSERSGLLFVGAIEPGSPNDDALLWFADNVASEAYERLGARTRHAGLLASRQLFERSARIEFLGIVPDLREVYGNAHIFIAPTRFA